MHLVVKPNDNLNEVLNTLSEGLLTVDFPENAVFKQKVILTRNDVIINGNNSTVVWDDHNGMYPCFGTSDSATFTIKSSNVKINGLNFENSFDYVGEKSKRDESVSKGMGLQAVALYTAKEADMVYFNNCCFRSYQDTLFADGINNVFSNCIIYGNVDFIFGKAYAVFSECKIISLAEGIIAAPSTLAESNLGLVFYKCEFKCSENVKSGTVYLARPWHPGGKPGVCSSLTAIFCHFDKHIKEEKWTSMTDSKGVTHFPSENRFSIV